MRQEGYFCEHHPDKGRLECKTFTCGHCSRVVFLDVTQKPEEAGGRCYGCMSLICPACVQQGGCSPIERKVEEAARRQDALRSYGMG